MPAISSGPRRFSPPSKHMTTPLTLPDTLTFELAKKLAAMGVASNLRLSNGEPIEAEIIYAPHHHTHTTTTN
jgi:hypothetical protein